MIIYNEKANVPNKKVQTISGTKEFNYRVQRYTPVREG